MAISRKRISKSPSVSAVMILLLHTCMSMFLFLSTSSVHFVVGKKHFDKSISTVTPAVILAQKAIDDAKKLVDDLSEAATGTVTAYAPGREKEPVTCNEIMAKALIVANEEKAEKEEERESVVQAARILSERIDDLGFKLDAANAQIEEAAAAAEAVQANVSDEIANIRSEAYDRLRESQDETVAETKESHATVLRMRNATVEEIRRIQEVSAGKLASKDAEIAAMLDDAQEEVIKTENILIEASAQAEAIQQLTMEMHKRTNDGWEARLDAEVEGHAVEVDALHTKLEEVAEESERVRKVAQEEVSAAQNAAEEKVASITSTSEKELERVRKEAQEEVSAAQHAAEEEVASITSTSERESEQVRKEAQEEVSAAQHAAEEKVASITSTSEKEQTRILEHAEQEEATNRQNMNHERQEMKKAAEEQTEEFQRTIKSIKEQAQETFKHASDNWLVTLDGERRKHEEVKEALQNEMDDAIAQAAALRKSEEENHEEKVNEFNERIRKLSLGGDELAKNTKELRKIVSNRELDVSFWKSTHESQGYCNTTLMRQDSVRIASTWWEWTQRQSSGALTAGSKYASEVYSDAIFKSERYINIVWEEVAAHYNEHLAPSVDQHVVPTYNKHIHPVYIEHVSPVVDRIKRELEDAVEKYREVMLDFRAWAVSAVESASSATLEYLEEKSWADTFVPECATAFLIQIRKDGGDFLDTLWSKSLYVLLFASRRLIFRLFWKILSIFWFFCPLRCFVNGKKTEKFNANGKIKISSDGK